MSKACALMWCAAGLGLARAAAWTDGMGFDCQLYEGARWW